MFKTGLVTINFLNVRRKFQKALGVRFGSLLWLERSHPDGTSDCAGMAGSAAYESPSAVHRVRAGRSRVAACRANSRA
jgi:hypothetical protein